MPASLTATVISERHGQSCVVGVQRQRRRDRLPDRALPGKRAARPSCRSPPRAEQVRPTATRASSTQRSYRYRVRAVDAVPNLGAYSNIADATTPPPARSRARSRRMRSTRAPGATVTDASGTGTRARLPTSWSSSGKYGKALSFNGVAPRHDPRLRLPAPQHRDDARSLGQPLGGHRELARRDMKGNDNYFLVATSNPGGQPHGGGDHRRQLRP